MVGLVKQFDWDEQVEEFRYRVQLGSALRGIPESDLELLPTDADPWADAMAGRFAMAAPFRARLTYERLRKPPSRIAASFGSARAAFYPYQFKPLLKFLESRGQRLLIADDVGLGKTIEAGYILREMRVRHGLERVLIVAPARLQSKWKGELERRFDETFEVVRTRSLLQLRARLDRDQLPEPFRWITSFEAARDPRVIELLERFEPAIDLVIVDEAHRMRNSSTAQHALGRALAACADALVFLTATPIQTGLENLFNLLRLLEPSEFADFEVFRKQTEANRGIIRLANGVRSGALSAEDLEEIVEELAGNPYTSQITGGTYFESIVSRGQKLSQLSRSERIELQRDVAELSLTSGLVSRTRKSEVLPDRPQRKAHSVRVALTPEERAFYQSVASIYQRIRPELSDWGLVMATLMAYRYTASCIPASIEFFRQKSAMLDLEAFFQSEVEIRDDWSESELPLIQSSQELASALRMVLNGSGQVGGKDSKYAAFEGALRDIWADDDAGGRPRRKVIVFSFFKRTLRYLSGQLERAGIVHRLISGDFTIDDRESKIEEFASVPDIKVLLSSEVGAEGLDLQFASVVVNYDLPWNPMVVEQRIGRIDRIGQQSPTITIVNLVAENTIEDRILLRLYERIGIFQEAIGEIDPILGETIEKLTMEALRGSLSDEEAAQRLEQAADAFRLQEAEAQRLGRDADALMAADQAFLDEVEAMVGKRRVPGPTELFEFVSGYLRLSHPGSRLSTATMTGIDEVHLDTQVAQAMRSTLELDADVLRVARKIDAGRFVATFDQQAALVHARAELIHARHPLVRLAFEYEARSRGKTRAFSLRLRSPRASSPGLVAGIYAFAVWLFELTGVRGRVEVMPLVVQLGSETPLDESAAESLFLHALDSAEDLDLAERVPTDQIEHAAGVLRSVAKAARQRLFARESGLDAARALRRRATLESTHSSRVRSATQRLEHLVLTRAAPFAVRMAETKLDHARNALAALASEFENPSRFSIEDEEIVVGLFSVSDGGEDD